MISKRAKGAFEDEDDCSYRLSKKKKDKVQAGSCLS